MSLTKSQLEARSRSIGGSDVAAIMGLSPWKTTVELWHEKRSGNRDGIKQNQAMRMGHLLEPVVAQMFKEEHPEYRVMEVPEGSTLRHPEHPWMVAHPDRTLLDEKGNRGILEIKTSRNRFDYVPEHYELQVRHYMAVMDADYAYLAVLVAGMDYQEFKLTRSRTMEKVMIDEQSAFMESLELDLCPYAAETSTDFSLLFPIADKKLTIQANDLVLEWVAEANRLRDEIEQHSERLNKVKMDIANIMGEAHKIVDSNGKALVSYPTVAGRKTFDVDAYKAAHSKEEVERWMKEGAPYRRMTVRTINDE